jgi:hypothetical protein
MSSPSVSIDGMQQPPGFLPTMVSTGGNGWSWCIGANKYDNIKINIATWCQSPPTIFLNWEVPNPTQNERGSITTYCWTLHPSSRSPPNSPPPSYQIAHSARDLRCDRGGMTSKGNIGPSTKHEGIWATTRDPRKCDREGHTRWWDHRAILNIIANKKFKNIYLKFIHLLAA